MQNARLDESQAGIKIARRKINLRYANNTPLMTESEEELFLEESEKPGLKFNIQKTKIMASGPNFTANRRGKSGSSDRFYFLGLQNHCGL